MNAASMWCNAWDLEEISDEVLAERVSELLETSNGARGFFVISLSSNSPLMDRLPDALVFQLRKAGDIVVELTAKNFVMSSAMALHHKRNKKVDQQSTSQKIQMRCLELLRILEPNSVKKKLESLLEALEGKGNDMNFINRCNFDNEQHDYIFSSINSIAENKKGSD